MFSRRSPPLRTLAFAIVAGALAGLASGRAGAEALLLVDVNTGKVLHAENATYPWYPASVTKLMTTYTTLRAVREGRITLDSVFTVSAIAAAQSPTKMGFPVGTQVTVDNAIKMLMVKSANDMAVLLAEGVSGSIENFSAEMNRNAQAARHDADQLRQPERAAGRRADHLGARPRHPGAGADPRVSRIRCLLASARHPHGQAGGAQLQHAARPLCRAPTA